MAFLSSSPAVCLARPWGGLWRLLLLMVLALSSSRPALAADPSPTVPEYQLKAVFLFNFAQFVDWPEEAFANAQAPLVIGVLGEDPFGAYLDDLVQSERIGERPIVIRRFRRPQDVIGCHILFVSRNQAAHFDRIAPELKVRNLLTVGDTDSFNRQGGLVRFVTEGGKIRLRINAEAAKRCGLTISSKLLRWAILVTPEKG